MNNQSEIIEAIESNDINKFRELIDRIDVNVKLDNEFCPTFLHHAAYYGCTEIVRILLYKNAYQYILNDKGLSAMNIARAQLMNDTAALLEYARTIDSQAVANNQYELIKAIIGSIQFGDINRFKELIYSIYVNANVIVNVKLDDEFYPTFLHYAAYYGCTEIVRILLKEKADPYVVNNMNLSARWIAIKQGHNCIATALLQNVQIREHKADKEKFFVAITGNYIDKVRSLLYKDKVLANAIYSNNNGNTALHIAAEHSCIKIAKLLIDNEAYINATNSLGETPLHLAAHSGELSMVKFLIQYRADISILDNNGCSSIQKAEQNGHIGVVEYIKSLVTNKRKLLENQDEISHVEREKKRRNNQENISICLW